MSHHDIEKLIRDRKLSGLKFGIEKDKSEKPTNLNQLFLEDLKKIPIGVDLSVMLVKNSYSGGKSFSPFVEPSSSKKSPQSFAFTGIVNSSAMWYFNNPKMPYGRELHAYGCIVGPGNKWQKDIWLVFTDESLREWYEENRRN